VPFSYFPFKNVLICYLLQGNYDGIIVFVYDDAQKLLDTRKFIEDLRGTDGIIDVIVIPGIS